MSFSQVEREGDGVSSVLLGVKRSARRRRGIQERAYIALELVQERYILVRQPFDQASLHSPFRLGELATYDGLASGGSDDGGVILANDMMASVAFKDGVACGEMSSGVSDNAGKDGRVHLFVTEVSEERVAAGEGRELGSEERGSRGCRRRRASEIQSWCASRAVARGAKEVETELSVGRVKTVALNEADGIPEDLWGLWRRISAAVGALV